VSDGFDAARAALVVILPSEEELAAHAAYLAALDKESRGRCLWLARDGQARLAA
jgi:DNA polymerase-3 subunit epsilon